MNEDKFMLLVWDLTLYSRFSDDVTAAQYGDMADLFVTLWPLSAYTVPSVVAFGGPA